jgi:Raf kinase inhibitor-like YbhB/YbcL family protein
VRGRRRLWRRPRVGHAAGVRGPGVHHVLLTGARGHHPAPLHLHRQGTSPPLEWSGAPARARELVLVVQDPDAPGGTFVHWTAFGLHATPSGRLPAGATPASGRNSAGHTGWTPPCPPKGDRPHRYEFSLYALPRPSRLRAGAPPAAVRAALVGALARGSFTARFGR